MKPTRRQMTAGLFAVLAMPTDMVLAQAGYPPPPAGMAPPSFGNPTQQHFEIQRHQENERRSFDAFQRSQQRETDRNLETLRRQQRISSAPSTPCAARAARPTKRGPARACRFRAGETAGR